MSNHHQPKPEVRMFSIENEQSVLGALLLDGKAIDDVASLLKADDFCDRRHQLIYGAMLTMSSLAKPIDVVTVAAQLSDRGQLTEVGEIAYLSDMATHTPSTVNVGRYARLVAGDARRRAVLDAGQQLATSAREEPDVDALLTKSLDALGALQDHDDQRTLSANDLAIQTLQDITHRYDNPGLQTGTPTGLTAFDARLGGGLQGGDLIILAGRPGMGKSVVAQCIADHVALTSGHVLVYSIEMSEKQLGQRQLAAASGVPLAVLKSGQLEDDHWAPLSAGAARLSEYRQTICFDAAITTHRVRADARRQKRRGPLAGIVIDYLQLMEAPAGDTQNLRVGANTRALKQLAKELDIPVIALSQLSRKVEERANKRPMLSDLRESGNIEQDADVIVFCYRDDYYNPDSHDKGLIEIITAKNRQGELGTDRAEWQGECARVRDLPAGWAPPAREHAETAPRRRGLS